MDGDIDFVDVATVVAGGLNGNDALRTLSGTVGVSVGDETSMTTTGLASTSSPRRPPIGEGTPPPPAHEHQRKTWFSSLFGGSGALPSAVAAARSKTVREWK